MRLIEAKFGENNYKFGPEKLEKKELLDPYITVLIGPNASGKSRCLSKIADAFRKAHDARAGKKLESEFYLKFENEFLLNEINSQNFKSFENEFLPDSVISISNSLADKFPLKAKVSDVDFYEYIGVRDAGFDQEKFAIYALVDTLQEIGADNLMVEKTKEVFEFLSLEPKVWISLKTNRSSDSKVYNMLFHDRWSEDQWVEELLSSSRFNRLSASQKSQINRDLRNQTYLMGLREFIINNRHAINEDAKSVNAFLLNFNEDESLQNFEQNFKYFTLLRKLNVLMYDRIEVKKADEKIKYNLLDSSSGEVCLLTTFVRTIPHLTNNSLILIDEPEISLHPNWQLQYIPKLKKLLNGCFDIHVIIATHSPYILSDIKPENGCVVKMLSSKGIIETEILPSTPYAWSVEDVLYNVFGVVTTRNKFVGEEIAEILDELSKGEKNLKNKLDDGIYERIKYLQKSLKKEDPFKTVVDSILKNISS